MRVMSTWCLRCTPVHPVKRHRLIGLINLSSGLSVLGSRNQAKDHGLRTGGVCYTVAFIVVLGKPHMYFCDPSNSGEK